MIWIFFLNKHSNNNLNGLVLGTNETEGLYYVTEKVALLEAGLDVSAFVVSVESALAGQTSFLWLRRLMPEIKEEQSRE